MAFVLEPLGIPGVLIGVIDLFFATFVFLARPDRRQNRFLALMLLCSAPIIGGGYGLRMMFDDPATSWGLYAMGFAAILVWGWAYLNFLGTLDSPFQRFLNSKQVRLAYTALLFYFAWLYFFDPLSTVALRPIGGTAGFSPIEGPTPITTLGYSFFFGIWLLGLAVAITAYTRAKASGARAQMKWYLLAFACQDALLFGRLAYLVFVEQDSLLALQISIVGLAMAGFLLDLFLVYGIFKTQLFDIDLKLKWGIKQSTVAAAFFAVFFIVSEGAQQLFQSSFGPLIGLVAAGALVFVLAPLQRVAEGVASAAMPAVKYTEEYVNYRKVEVYRATVEEIVVDRTITEKERSILDRLREKLELGSDVAQAIERDALVARGA